MATPINTSNKHSTKGLLISGETVIWQGPDIPCINLCNGDSIDSVIYKLATKLCTISDGLLDLTTLDFKCLVVGDAVDPATEGELFQLIIDKICDIVDTCCGEGVTPDPPVALPLPECLWHDDPDTGDPVTEMLPDDYIQYLAERICEILLDITTIQLDIVNLTIRVEALENAVAPTIPDITILTQCASGPVAGVETLIDTAFEYLEGTICDFLALIGDNTQLSNAIATECTDISISEQLASPGDLMSDLAGWTVNPTTLAESFINLWLTVCDMRAKVITCCGPIEICSALPVTNTAISAVTDSNATVTWDEPITTYSEDPTDYYLEIYEWSGTGEVGALLYTTTVAFGVSSVNIPGVYDATKNYIVKVRAVYATCGNSSFDITIGQLRLDSIVYCISITDAYYADAPIMCGDTPVAYTELTWRTSAILKNIFTGLPVVNPGLPITVTVRYSHTIPCVVAPVDYDTTITIATGASTGYITYTKETYVDCDNPNACEAERYDYSCAVSQDLATAIFCNDVTEC